ncbi:TIGR02646 family protein [Candidatus Pantoea symbiotica]|uniref:TIGR02646 family protein n=1 Tax=Candidatus Pantoea symbiotica TaxID=1884370 RepID=A0A1I3SRA4_9GAMM|nr:MULTISPECIES: endonuclease [Pantoea]SFJ59977.1 TIGR02646 family protein [Pantoea symbiotica]SFU55218.1 TIGR02646 family protein [Pantoea sp. YR525]
MRSVKRGNKPPPPSLMSTKKDGTTELERVRAHMTKPLKPNEKRESFKFSVYKSDDVKKRLEELFHGKCAYCESFYASQAPVDVEHYRPKGAVEGEHQHPGYWWVAMDWENLLPSCIDCNRRRKQIIPVVVNNMRQLHQNMQTGKKDSFPILGVRSLAENKNFSQEKPLLLDPTRDNPSEHITYCIKNDNAVGLIIPQMIHDVDENNHDYAMLGQERLERNISIRGAISIQVYGLNRIKLVQERISLINRMRFLEEVVVELGTIIQNLNNSELNNFPDVINAIKSIKLLQEKILTEMRNLTMPHAPFSSLAKAYLDDFKDRLRAELLNI